MSKPIDLVAEYKSGMGGARVGDVAAEHRTYVVPVSLDGAHARLLLRVIVDAKNQIIAVRRIILTGPNKEPLPTVDSTWVEDKETVAPPK